MKSACREVGQPVFSLVNNTWLQKWHIKGVIELRAEELLSMIPEKLKTHGQWERGECRLLEGLFTRAKNWNSSDISDINHTAKVKVYFEQSQQTARKFHRLVKKLNLKSMQYFLLFFDTVAT